MPVAFVSITFDDGLRCQFDKAIPVLREYKLPSTFFLIANQEPTHDHWYGHTNDWWKIDWREDDIAMLKGLVREGHEIGSHSVSHHPQILRQQPEVEVRESKTKIENWIGTTVCSFCYPFYWSHSFLAGPARSAGYKQARTGPNRSYYSPQSQIDLMNVDSRQVAAAAEDVASWVRPASWAHLPAKASKRVALARNS